MSSSNFHLLAAREIHKIYDLIQEKILDVDADYFSDVLHIYTEDGEYVINQHSPSQQIWISSPLSNAGYFSYDSEKKDWLDKNGQSLRTRLSIDLKHSLL